jgi:predicted TIM-barrel enzyme
MTSDVQSGNTQPASDGIVHVSICDYHGRVLATTTGPAIFGVIHLPPLPGTPFYDARKYSSGISAARLSVEALVAGGATGALVQTADRVYDLGAPPDPLRVAMLTQLLTQLRAEVPETFHLGVQVMRNGVEESLAIALTTGCTFIRATALIGATLSASGWVEPNAASIMAYRSRIGAMDVQLYADIASVHNTWANEDLPQLAGRAYTAGAEAVVVGLPDLDLTMRYLRDLLTWQPDVPVVLAGHVNFDNASALLPLVDAVFVAGVFTPAGWGAAMDENLVARFVGLARSVDSNRRILT